MLIGRNNDLFSPSPYHHANSMAGLPLCPPFTQLQASVVSSPLLGARNWTGRRRRRRRAFNEKVIVYLFLQKVSGESRSAFYFWTSPPQKKFSSLGCPLSWRVIYYSLSFSLSLPFCLRARGEGKRVERNGPRLGSRHPKGGVVQ